MQSVLAPNDVMVQGAGPSALWPKLAVLDDIHRSKDNVRLSLAPVGPWPLVDEPREGSLKLHLGSQNTVATKTIQQISGEIRAEVSGEESGQHSLAERWGQNCRYRTLWSLTAAGIGWHWSVRDLPAKGTRWRVDKNAQISRVSLLVCSFMSIATLCPDQFSTPRARYGPTARIEGRVTPDFEAARPHRHRLAPGFARLLPLNSHKPLPVEILFPSPQAMDQYAL